MCTECGAPDNQCASRFDECLVKEFEDAGYGRVHHLTVCAYMLQHSSKLSREGWLYERDLLRKFLIEGKPPEQVRKEQKDAVDSGKRSFKLKSKDGLPVIPQTRWSKTVLDIRLEDAVQYCEDVVAWASATLTDSEAIEVRDAG
jgi:hypothetical protein